MLEITLIKKRFVKNLKCRVFKMATGYLKIRFLRKNFFKEGKLRFSCSINAGNNFEKKYMEYLSKIKNKKFLKWLPEV